MDDPSSYFLDAKVSLIFFNWSELTNCSGSFVVGQARISRNSRFIIGPLPLAGVEPAHLVPETSALSTELQGPPSKD